MTKRQKIIIAIGGAIVLLIVFNLYQSNKSKEAEKKKARPSKVIRKVNTTFVSYNDHQSEVSGNGRVISQRSVYLISEVMGKIEAGNVLLKKGINFRQGDVLARIYDRDAFYALQSRKSRFLNQVANILPDLKIDYPDSYENWLNFFEDVTLADPIPELPPIGSNQEKIFLSSQNILSEYFGIKSDEIKLDKYYIRAPFNGAIQDVLLETGSVANPGSRIASIIKTDQLEVEVPLDIEASQWVDIGDEATLFTNSNLPVGIGRVVRKSEFVDPSTQAINVFLSVSKPKQNIYTGEYLRADFDGGLLHNVMEIPRSAVFNSNEVFVVDSGYLKITGVEVVKRNETTLLFRGLPDSTELVVEPLANANANMPVQTPFGNLHLADSVDIIPSDSLKN